MGYAEEENFRVVCDYSLVNLDSKELGGSLAPYDPLNKDVKFYSMFFTQLRYSHTKRESNKIGHSLARYAINNLDCVLWMKNIPLQIYIILQADIAVFSYYKCKYTIWFLGPKSKRI